MDYSQRAPFDEDLLFTPCRLPGRGALLQFSAAISQPYTWAIFVQYLLPLAFTLGAVASFMICIRPRKKPEGINFQAFEPVAGFDQMRSFRCQIGIAESWSNLLYRGRNIYLQWRLYRFMRLTIPIYAKVKYD